MNPLLVLINSKKGQEIFSKVQSSIEYRECNLENCMQHNLKMPTKKPKARKKFWKDYKNNPFKIIIKKYSKENLNLVQRIKRRIKRYLKT